MSQSSESRISHPQPLLQKIAVALAVVLVGHVGVLWAVSQMKAPELKPIEKKTIKVKLIKMEEEILPPPPPPTVKPKVEPKPQPVVPPPPPVVKPKVIAQKPAPTKDKKVIHQDDTLAKQKLEQDRLNQMRQEQDRLNKARLEQDRLNKERLEKDRLDRERLEQDRLNKERLEKERLDKLKAEQNTQPRIAKEGQYSWSRKPSLSKDAVAKYVKASEGAKNIFVEVSADTSGKIINVKVLNGSGIDKLDQYVVRQTMSAKLNPYKENGVAVPFKIRQNFELNTQK